MDTLKEKKTVVVDIQKLQKTYPDGTQALESVDIQVFHGQFLAILGLSGAGKSTLLRCIGGLIAPTRGQMQVGDYTWDGRERTLRSFRQISSMIFQDFHVFKHQTVLENVLIGRLPFLSWSRWLSRRFPKRDKDIAFEALQKVGLAEKVYSRVKDLSGGQRQRVGIARAIVQEPVLLLADEPVASLDPRTSAEILDLLRRICVQDGKTVICNLHQVEYGRQYSDRILGLAEGKVFIDRPVGRIQDHEINTIYGGNETHQMNNQKEPVQAAVNL
jgi:phosphonate transport system ATP-binding protein